MMMSVTHDCQAGDEIVCLEEFHASPDGEPFSWDTSRKFRVGERLRYVDSRLEARFADRPHGWHVVFESSDGKRYAATQTYFVTTDCWRGIKRYFAKRLMHEPKRSEGGA
jgi:hypothetical protein